MSHRQPSVVALLAASLLAIALGISSGQGTGDPGPVPPVEQSSTSAPLSGGGGSAHHWFD